MSPLRRRLVAAALVVAGIAATAGCSTVSLTPAPRAGTVGCANVIVQLPTTLEGLSMRDTDAQGTGAWGTPAGILLTCGITTPRVSDLPCNTVEGVDWLNEQKGKVVVYTTYGRSPGVRVVVDTSAVGNAPNVLFDVASAVGSLPQTAKCQSPSDTTPAP